MSYTFTAPTIVQRAPQPAVKQRLQVAPDPISFATPTVVRPQGGGNATVTTGANTLEPSPTPISFAAPNIVKPQGGGGATIITDAGTETLRTSPPTTPAPQLVKHNTATPQYGGATIITDAGTETLRKTPPPAPIQAPPIVIPPAKATTDYEGSNTIFSRVDSAIADDYNRTLRDVLSGKIYDPLAAKTQEALARREAQERAKAAAGIAQAGFTGTGIGKQIASGVESSLGANRFDTSIGIEAERNQLRMQGLGEARGLATTEDSSRQNENRFKLAQETFADEQARYGDTKNWKAFEQALMIGSDADVAAAYMQATGKNLDPAAISEYREIDRRAKNAAVTGLETQTEAQQQAAMEVKREAARKNFVNLIQTRLDWRDMTPDARASDVEFQRAAEELWKSSPFFTEGSTPPAGWAESQYQAMNDIRHRDALAATRDELAQQVAAGLISQEDADLTLRAMTDLPMQYWKVDPETGRVVFDTEKFMKDTTANFNINDGTKTDSASTTIPPKPDGTEYKPGESYTEGGAVYTIDSAGNRVKQEVDETDPWSKSNDRILSLLGEGDKDYETVFKMRLDSVLDPLNDNVVKIEDPRLLAEIRRQATEYDPGIKGEINIDGTVGPLVGQLAGLLTSGKAEFRSGAVKGSVVTIGDKTYKVVSDGNRNGFTGIDLATGERVSVTPKMFQEIKGIVPPVTNIPPEGGKEGFGARTGDAVPDHLTPGWTPPTNTTRGDPPPTNNRFV